MPWIKKNLTLVLGGLVGLILLGGSGFFLYSQSSRETAVNTSLEEKRAEWNRLNGVTPYPDEKNIKAVKDEAARVEKLANSLKESIRPVDVPQVNDTYSLKLLIETTIADLKKEADDAGVQVPSRYAFTFQRLRELPSFESNKVGRISEQVMQVATICRVLYDAKVHTLDTLRRSPVLKDEGNSSDYLTKQPVSKDGITRAPFDFSFRAFSGELAEVIKGFAELSNCVVIKTINIDPTSLPQPQPANTPGLQPQTMPNPAMGPGGPGRPGGMDPALAARYGLAPGGGRPGEGGGGGMDAAMRSRYGLGPGGGMEAMRQRYGGGGGAGATAPSTLSQSAATGTAAPAAPSTPSVVLDEKPLRVIFQIDFVKPTPPGEPAPARKAAPAAAPADGSAAAPEATRDAAAGAGADSEPK